MSQTYHIRQATLSDIPVIMQLAEATWAPTYSSILSQEQISYMFKELYTAEKLKRQMQEGQTFLLFVAEEGPVGFAAYSVKEEAAAVFKLNKIYLLPQTQGKGYGKKLLTAVEAEVRRQGGVTLDLNVNRHNKAKAFYERCGYHVHKQEDIPIGPYWMNDYVMRKALA